MRPQKRRYYFTQHGFKSLGGGGSAHPEYVNKIIQGCFNLTPGKSDLNC